MGTLDLSRWRTWLAIAMAALPAACAPSPGKASRSTRESRATCPASFTPLPAGSPSPPPVVAGDSAEEPLAPAWEIRPAAGRILTFGGIVDDAGNTFWSESVLESGATELASASRDGAVRFRAAAGPGPFALAGTLVVTASRQRGGCRDDGAPAADAYSTADGSHAWHRDLLPVVERWMRSGGACRYGNVSGFAVQGAHLVIAVSILDHGTTEHEAGYVALDVATGAVAWSSRTSEPGNVMPPGPPRVAADGTGYGTRTEDYQRDDLLVFPDGAQPRPLWTAVTPWHGEVVAVAGPLMVTEATGGSSWSGPPRGAEIRCRADGSRIGSIGGTGAPLISSGRLWFFGDQIASYDALGGNLLWRVALTSAASPPGRAARSVIFRTTPVVTRTASILFIEQQGIAGAASSAQSLGTPLLREIDAGGREVLRRKLRVEREAFQGALALRGGRIFLGGQVLPSAGAYGVIRAFDVPGRDVATTGWIAPGGSLARDNRAR